MKSMSAKLFKSRNAQRAFSMVEVLVAMVVLSVGLLGIAALYVTALQSGSSAIARMQAVNIATDLADRIRGNRAAVANYDTNVTRPWSCEGQVENLLPDAEPAECGEHVGEGQEETPRQQQHVEVERGGARCGRVARYRDN